MLLLWLVYSDKSHTASGNDGPDVRGFPKAVDTFLAQTASLSSKYSRYTLSQALQHSDAGSTIQQYGTLQHSKHYNSLENQIY